MALFVRVLSIWGKDAFARWARRGYGLYRLSKSSVGRDVKIRFPFHVEGAGRLSLGDGTVVHPNVTLACGEGGEIDIGAQCSIGERACVRTAMGARIVFGERCVVGAFTEISASARWVVGEGSHIHSGCAVSSREGGCDGVLTIGKGSHICDSCVLDVSGDLAIGNEVAIGVHSVVYTHDHDYRSADPIAWKGHAARRKVDIGHGAWIGARVIILPGVRIGERAVVAAGAVVTRDVPPGMIVGGVPARPLRCRLGS